MAVSFIKQILTQSLKIKDLEKSRNETDKVNF